MNAEEFADEAESVLQEWLDGAYTFPEDGHQQHRIQQLKSEEGNLLFSAEPLKYGPTHVFSVTILVTEVTEGSETP